MLTLDVWGNLLWILFIPCIAALPTDPKIVNGTVAIVENTRHQVSIRRKSTESIFGTGHICGGSLIASTVVLSAAHCFHDDVNGGFFSSRGYYVAMGTLDRFEKNENTITFEITHIVFADFDRPTFRNDVAILFLDGTVPPLNPDVKVIPMNREIIPVGEVCQVSGWGVTDPVVNVSSDILMILDVPIIDKKNCSINYGESAIYDGMICAGYMEGERDACSGDSGGPLVSKGRLVGIVSFGESCALPGYPGVYVDVRRYVDWIEKTIKENGANLKSVSGAVGIFCVLLYALLT